MRQDQFDRLQTLSERLTDVFLDEADPEAWPGDGLRPDQMTSQTRGDRYWAKKNAAATLVLVGKIHNLTDAVRKATAGGGAEAGAVADGPDEIDAEIAAAEKEAARLLDKAQRAAKKSKFDKHVHGDKS